MVDSENKLLSIVIPVYNEVGSLKELYEKISKVFENSKYEIEIIFVDDGSTDGSCDIEEEIAEKDSRVKVIQLNKNYGKAVALTAGFQTATGDYIATIDADLQDDPAEIPKMLEMLEKDGYDLISGWKKKRRDPITKVIPSKIFNAATSLMTGVRIHDFNCGLKVYRKEVASKLSIYGGLYRYIPAMVHLMGYKVGEKEVLHHPRKYGKSKYGSKRFYHGFWDLVTVLFLSKYLRRPLHLFGLPGILSFLAGFGILVYLAVGWFRGIWIGNRPIFFLGILLMIVGLQFISIGLLAEMIAHGHKKDEYIIKKKIG
ncbi:MAG: glycosyltransferase family 2 protein [Candidatus Marinimicrobia bacterium]|nr:glycosyltransferase family 2 protein [Candidatus Neomarinimicrobiota bacterium]